MIPDATSNELWILWIARAIYIFLRLWHVTALGPRTICWEIVSLLVMLGRILVYWCIVPFTWIVHNLCDGSNLHDAWCYTCVYIYIHIHTHNFTNSDPSPHFTNQYSRPCSGTLSTPCATQRTRWEIRVMLKGGIGHLEFQQMERRTMG